MATTPTIPMFSPDGTLGDVPYDKMHDALGAGAKIGVNVISPTGDHGVIPADKLPDAIKAGAKTIPFDLHDADGGKKGFWSTLKEKALGIYQDPTGGHSISDPKFWYNPDTAKFAPGTGALAQGATHPIPEGTPTDVLVNPPGTPTGPVAHALGRGIYRVASTLAPLAGGNAPESEASAAKGDTGAVAAEAALPIAAAVGGPLTGKAASSLSEVAPAAIRSGWKTIGNPFGLASTGQELLTQGISPRTSLLNFKPSLERAAGDLAEFDKQSRINSVQDLHEAIPEIKQKIWNEEVEPALQRQATKSVEMQPVADAVRGQISDEMRTFDEGNAEKLDKLADKLEGTKDVQGANKLLKYINGQLESYFQKFPAARRANLMNNPETAGWEAARAELRNQFLDTLESNGETGVRDARLRYGAFDTLQDAVERRVNVADRAKPMSLGRIVGIAGALPTHGGSVIAGELSNYLNKPDVLISRGISKLPIRTTPFAPPAIVSPLTGAAIAANTGTGNP